MTKAEAYEAIVERLRDVAADDPAVIEQLPTDPAELTDLARDWWAIYRREHRDLPRTVTGVTTPADVRRAADLEALHKAVALR